MTEVSFCTYSESVGSEHWSGVPSGSPSLSVCELLQSASQSATLTSRPVFAAYSYEEAPAHCWEKKKSKDQQGREVCKFVITSSSGVRGWIWEPVGFVPPSAPVFELFLVLWNKYWLIVCEKSTRKPASERSTWWCFICILHIQFIMFFSFYYQVSIIKWVWAFF